MALLLWLPGGNIPLGTRTSKPTEPRVAEQVPQALKGGNLCSTSKIPSTNHTSHVLHLSCSFSYVICLWFQNWKGSFCSISQLLQHSACFTVIPVNAC